MDKQNFDRQWRFTMDKKSMTVDLPHDYSIIQKRDPNSFSGPGNGYFPGGVADYEKKLFVPEEWQGKKIMLEFEGVYMNATVRINRNIVAQHPYGYTSFHCDLTSYLQYGKENTVSVNVNNNALPNTRWYSGSGIYRHVWLMVAEPVHIAPYGIFVYTPDTQTVCVETEIENCGVSAGELIIKSTILSADGKLVAVNEQRTAMQGDTIKVKQEMQVDNSELWSVDNPYLYTMKSEVIINGNVIDSTETKFGIRMISFDAKNGFQLNGKTMKMKGGCVHHDCGLLGAAAYDRAEERKIELLKASGYDAVRCAHNPPSPAFLDACDRLGMLVMDEAFDCWREGKMPNDYNMSFEAWWKKDMASMVLRDRNHPSIVMWSTGNEIPERAGRSDGYAIAKELADFVRSLDTTRPVTNAVCDLWGQDDVPDELREADAFAKMTEKFIEPLDIVGYNYLLYRYEKDGTLFPNRVIVGTETFPKDAFDYWAAVEKLPYVIGDFVWTSLDYLGEAGIGHIWYNNENTFCGAHPWNQAFCGDIDICGFKRPQSYYRDFVWGIGDKPYIAVGKPEFYGKKADISHWGWPDVVSSWSWNGFEGKPVIVEVYSDGDEVELLCNGKSLGRQPAGKANKYLAKFETVYEPGELTAVAYLNGAEKSRSALITAGEPAQIRLCADRKSINAVHGDLSFIAVELLDKNGNIAHQAANKLFFTASGAGSLVAVGNGDPKSDEMYVGAERHIHEGRAMAVVKANGESGVIVLNVSAEGIPAAQIEITVG